MSAFPVILSAPSGAGKTTIAEAVVRRRGDIGFSISATTRARREYEAHGREYFFLTPEEFERRRVAGDFAECAQVHGRWYGTLKAEVERVLAAGQHLLMDIDVQGARAFRAAFPDAVLIFILPPSLEVMMARLDARQSETRETLTQRMRTAATELAAVEEYDYVIVNDDLEAAVVAVSGIIDAEAGRVVRGTPRDRRAAGVLEQLRRDILVRAQETT